LNRGDIMKKSKISFLALLVVISIISISVIYTQQPQHTKINIPFAGSGGSITATLNCTLPKVPNEVPVLKIAKCNYTSVESMRIARELFNMTGELVPYGRYGFRNGSSELVLGSDGSVWFKFYESRSYGALKVSFQEARNIADAFLKKVEGYGLAPRSPEIQIEFSEVESVEYYGIEGTIYPTLLCVSYRTLFNGIPIIRGGVYVYIGGSGELFEFLGAWRNVEVGTRIPITVSPAEALNKLGSYWHMPLGSKVTDVVINKVELVYLADPAPSEQSEILPAYCFDCEVVFEDGSKQRYVTFAPATGT
jgi:hypothetical protein